MISLMMPITVMSPYKYPMDHDSNLFEPKNGKKSLKTCFLALLTSVTSYSTHKYFVRGLFLSSDIRPYVLPTCRPLDSFFGPFKGAQMAPK
jgi:hypothetical protein